MTPFKSTCTAGLPLLAASLLVLASCENTGPGARVHTLPPPAPTPVTGSMTVTGAPYVNTQGVNPLDIPNKNAPGYANPYPEGSYENFVARPSYPKTLDVYADDALLQQVDAVNSKLIICIPQQRARLYVHGRVAFDWPVSTGTNGHETPTGAFRIMDKKEQHHSNRYGKFVNAKGRTTDSNADTAKGVPEGMTFRPASMPNWHRLTWDGVGIHGGKVVAGRRLSHGCIRTPYDVARKFFKYSVRNMPVYITRAVEDYNRGGHVKPIDVKYRPQPGNDYTDTPQPLKRI